MTSRDAAAPGEDQGRADQVTGGDQHSEGYRQEREKFPMPPESLVRRLPAMALKLYCYLDMKQGDKPWPVKGYRHVAKALGWDRHTVQKWAEYLEARGVIEITGENRQGRTMWVIHNPARFRVAAGVNLPAMPERSDAKSRPFTEALVAESPRSGSAVTQLEAPPLGSGVTKALGLSRSGDGLGPSEEQQEGTAREQEEEHEEPAFQDSAPSEIDDDFGSSQCQLCGRWNAWLWDSGWYCADCEPFTERAMARSS